MDKYIQNQMTRQLHQKKWNPLKKNQVEILELKDTIIKIKMSTEGFTSRLNTGEKRISTVGQLSRKYSAQKTKEKKKNGNIENSARDT